MLSFLILTMSQSCQIYQLFNCQHKILEFVGNLKNYAFQSPHFINTWTLLLGPYIICIMKDHTVWGSVIYSQ